MLVLKSAAFFTLIVGAIVPLMLLLDSSTTPPLSPARAAAAQSRLDEFCGGKHWQNARWYSPIIDDQGRTRVRVQFDYSEQRVDATIVLIGDRVHALVINPAGDASGVSDWLRSSEK